MTTPQRRRDTDIQSKDLQNESRFKPKQLAFDEIYDGKDSSRYARGSGAVPSAEEGISQGDMLIEAKQKRMQSASAGGADHKSKSKIGEEEDRKTAEYRQYMKKLMSMQFTRKQ